MVGALISAYHYTDEISKYCCLWSSCMPPTYIRTYNMSFLNYNRVNVTVTVSLESSKREEKSFPANSYLFKINNRNTRKRCKICGKLTVKTPERRN